MEILIVMVPEDIRQVKRPKNTVVLDTGSRGPHRYVVRERKGAKLSKGNNYGPRNGRVIGFIVNHKFIAKNFTSFDVSSSDYKQLQYGASAFIFHACKDITDDLYSCFTMKDANKIMAIAALRVIHPGIACNRYESKYEMSFLKVFYPTIGWSSNSIGSFLFNLGKDNTLISKFHQCRLNRTTEQDNIIIDGMLKQDSGDNSLSKPSAKFKLKKHNEISVMYAYNLQMTEVVCAKVYPGNMLDIKAFKDFIVSNKIFKGIIVCDKGFSVSEIEEVLEAYPDLHYIIPLKRNNKAIAEHNALNFTNSMEAPNGNKTLYCKRKIDNNRFLYGFRNEAIALREEQRFVDSSLKNDGLFDGDSFSKKLERFGTIVFESDVDIKPFYILYYYDHRWVIETAFDHFKNTLDLDITRVQEMPSIVGNEFINYISTLITCKLIKALKAVDEKFGKTPAYSLKAKIEDLKDIFRNADAPLIGSIYDGCWNLPGKNDSMILLGRLGLLKDYPGGSIDLQAVCNNPTFTPEHGSNSNIDDNAPQNIILSPIKEKPLAKAMTPITNNSHSSSDHTSNELGECQRNFLGPIPQKRRGRPAGRKNNKTLEKERQAKAALANQEAVVTITNTTSGPANTIADASSHTIDKHSITADSHSDDAQECQSNFVGPMPQKRRGRPAGRKNNKTIEKERQAYIALYSKDTEMESIISKAECALNALLAQQTATDGGSSDRSYYRREKDVADSNKSKDSMKKCHCTSDYAGSGITKNMLKWLD